MLPLRKATWLEAGGTDRTAATAATLEMYDKAGLEAPEVAWFESPLAALKSLPHLVSQVEHESIQTNPRRRLDNRRTCHCPDCSGSSVTSQVVPVSSGNVPATRLGTTARHIAGIVRRAVGRARGTEDEHLRHDTMAAPPTAFDITLAGVPQPRWLPENQWVAWARINRRRHVGLESLNSYRVLAETTGWWWFNRGLAVLAERPIVLHVDARERLHNPTGPAVAYGDGFAVNVIDGIVLPEWYFEDDAVTIERIESEPNLEVRRLLIDRFGGDRYVEAADGLLIHEDETGQLWSILRTIHQWRRIEVRMVRVVDATPQPDGSCRVYWLHVPSSVETARAAVAWTFGLVADEYAPVREA